MQEMVKKWYVFILLSLVATLTDCTSSRSNLDEREACVVAETCVELDSIHMDFTFYPERWNMKGDTLWVLNTRDSLFLTGYSIPQKEVICSWGTLGQGPEEYVVPGIIEGACNESFTLYGNTGNKIVGYSMSNGRPMEKWRGSFPVWMSQKGLPKPYTRVAAVNDSIFIGTYFFPRQAGADMLNGRSGELVSEIELGIEQPDEHMSGPYQFKIATSSGGMFVAAYRYIDRFEVYDTDGCMDARITYAIGNAFSQNDLYESDRDNEMKKFYSDVQCDARNAYLLYHGVPEQELEYSPTYLHIYDLESGKNVKNIKIDKYIDCLLVTDDGMIILYSPSDEDKIFMFNRHL